MLMSLEIIFVEDPIRLFAMIKQFAVITLFFLMQSAYIYIYIYIYIYNSREK